MLNPDYAEILSLLQKHNVDFLLVGAYAMAVHGFPRATADIDIFVDANPEKATRLMTVLQEFGAPVQDTTADELSVPGIVFQIGVAPRRIDILTQIDGLTFAQAVRKAQHVQIGDLNIPVISKENLIKNKRASGREKDLLDAKELEKL